MHSFALEIWRKWTLAIRSIEESSVTIGTEGSRKHTDISKYALRRWCKFGYALKIASRTPRGVCQEYWTFCTTRVETWSIKNAWADWPRSSERLQEGLLAGDHSHDQHRHRSCILIINTIMVSVTQHHLLSAGTTNIRVFIEALGKCKSLVNWDEKTSHFQSS